MATIYTNNTYFIKRLNATRFCIVYGNDVICKYNNDKDGIREMITDFLYFAIEDKILKKADKKKEIERINKALEDF